MGSDYDETPGTSPTRVGVGWGVRRRFPNLKHFHPPKIGLDVNSSAASAAKSIMIISNDSFKDPWFKSH